MTFFLFFCYPCNGYFLLSLRPFGSSLLCILSSVGSCTHLTDSSRDTNHSVVYNAERAVIGCCLHFMLTSSSAAPIRLTLNPPIYNKIPPWGKCQFPMIQSLRSAVNIIAREDIGHRGPPYCQLNLKHSKVLDSEKCHLQSGHFSSESPRD